VQGVLSPGLDGIEGTIGRLEGLIGDGSRLLLIEAQEGEQIDGILQVLVGVAQEGIEKSRKRPAELPPVFLDSDLSNLRQS